ncbi:hypothetical protein DASC09_023140 [Saccharomycopsis crataegensis]|uniref:NADH dehydrogenase [ubiquinone] iron-sulfur protein 4, mitochondrial n=1 Tax=Saccharomycopsis crataegensis TaxID=43959 RepID=A0AAV5QJT0_9ASCO|nr:hypothetical protein DASC09_023140 [Saccharomycopsis crataegensis]
MFPSVFKRSTLTGTAVRPLQFQRFYSVKDVITKEDTNEVSLTEQQQELPKEIISGAPKELVTERQVRIYQEAKSAMQSAHNNGKFWRIDWDVLGKGNRWENDLMGYQGSSDYMQAWAVKFDTLESAIRFAKGQGWTYYVQEPKHRHIRKKEYSDNFFYSKGPLKHIRTK